MESPKAPLFEKLNAYRLEERCSFHVPGHKSGQGIAEYSKHLFERIMSIDLTEITGLDDLHQPSGVICEAQQLAAQYYGARETFFLINGSTAGNLSIILTLCQRGDILLVQRNVHKSVIHGLMLAGAQAVFMPSRYDSLTQTYTSVHLQDVEKALSAYPDAKGVLLTSPSYYGLGIDLKPIADLVHTYHLPLIVDEAHGAHYGSHPLLPASALQCGADAVVQSTHKMLTAMTMGAMLHVQGDRIPVNRLRQRLMMLQSSSPSYPIMASLDLARQQLQLEGAVNIERSITRMLTLRNWVNGTKVYQCIAGPSSAYDSQDPFKLIIQDATRTFSGFELQQQLEELGCMIEMADEQQVLVLFSLFSSVEDIDRLKMALAHIIEQNQLDKKELHGQTSNISSGFMAGELSSPIRFDIHLSDHMTENSCLVTLSEAVHKQSAEMVIPYPPGIPLLYPGEVITEQTAARILSFIRLGAKFHGGNHLQDEKIRVCKV